MTIYQAEMLRKAHGHGCDAKMDASGNALLVLHDGDCFAEVTKEGYLRYNYPEEECTKELVKRLCEDAKLVREYVGIYETAPPMKCADVPEYRQFSEFGSVVFAGMYSQSHGFMFCTWSQDMGGTYLAHGHYTPNYQAAKEDFATRAGLVSHNRLFNFAESIDLRRCIGYTRECCDAINYEQDRDLADLQEKLEDAYPAIKDHASTFDEDEGMQINM